MENNNYISHLRSQIREHKHNYSEDFGLIVRLPAQRLFRELIMNPGLFSDEECRLILDAYTLSTELVAKQKQLGYTLEEQLNELKTKSIPKIKNIIETYNCILRNHLELPNQSLITVLKSAIRDSEDLCAKLHNIENEDYGTSKTFLLRHAILRKFQKENNSYGVDGQQTMDIATSFTECYNAKVCMNEDGFITHVIGNIVKNLHEHAFVMKGNTDKYNVSEYIHYSHKGAFYKIYNVVRYNILISRLLKLFKKNSFISETKEEPVSENKVRIIFQSDKENANRLDVLIENNGAPFTGDKKKVFELGIGEGEGDHIGLYSARKFLEYYGATIEMYEPSYEDFTVGIKINLRLE